MRNLMETGEIGIDRLRYSGDSGETRLVAALGAVSASDANVIDEGAAMPSPRIRTMWAHPSVTSTMRTTCEREWLDFELLFSR